MSCGGAQAPDPRARVPRADAVRNLAKILQAAEEVFAAEGLAVPIDEVARRAGVGIGTVYRHFPTKEALFEAIVVARLEGLIERARRTVHCHRRWRGAVRLRGRAGRRSRSKKRTYTMNLLAPG